MTPEQIADTKGHPAMDNVEKVARALASADGLDWDEVCGVDDPATEGFCESGTCIATHWEDHDQEQARRWYLHLAQAAITALSTDVARLREALEICLEELYAPDPNCSCHICAPCSDCVEYNSIREARELALAALEARND